VINKKALTSGRQYEVGSSKGLTLDLAEVRRTDELLTALGFTPEISLNGYGELLEVRFVNPGEVNVGTVLDQNIHAIGVGEGRAEFWLDEQEYIKSFECRNVAVRYANGTLTIGDLKETVDDDSED
jgi:hypothetical protein